MRSLTKHHGHEAFLHAGLQEHGGNVDGAGGHAYLQSTRQHVDQEQIQEPASHGLMFNSYTFLHTNTAGGWRTLGLWM